MEKGDIIEYRGYAFAVDEIRSDDVVVYSFVYYISPMRESLDIEFLFDMNFHYYYSIKKKNLNIKDNLSAVHLLRRD